MGRIRIDIPEKHHFKTEMIIRVTDLNYGNHLANDKLLAYAHEARCRFLNSLGYSEFDIEGTSIIQSDAAVVYYSEGHLGDQVEILLTVTEVGSSAFDLIYDMHNKTTGKRLAVVKTAIVCYDYDAGKVNRIPEIFKNRFE